MTVQAALQTYPTLFLAAIVLLGLIVGSFLNVLIHRLPIMLERRWREECREFLKPGEAEPAPAFNLVTPRSQCPQCRRPVRALENIPLLSYLWLGGRCAGCNAPIPLRYPLVEGLAALLSLIVAWRFGYSWETAAGLLLTWALIALAVIDLREQLLPDAITLPLIWLGLLVNLGGVFTDLPSALIGAVAGYLSLWTMYQLFKWLTGKEGMGYGDFKLFALLGAWLGWAMLPLIILLSSLAGAVIGLFLMLVRGRDKNIPVPFGPYLAIAGWIALLWGNGIVAWYLGSL